jgi:hypothetical protein
VCTATVDITDENDASQAVFSAIYIALSVIMMVAALVQIGLITKPAWQRLQHYVQYIIQRVFRSSGSGSAVTDVELTETVRGVDAAAVGDTLRPRYSSIIVILIAIGALVLRGCCHRMWKVKAVIEW